jgi:glycosyltransferase involved in cell wall biosynthesis
MPSDRQHLIVWNCPRREEIAPPRIAQTRDLLRVLYHGSIEPDRLPPSTIEALAMLPAGVHLTVIGYETIGHRGYVQELRELACRLGVADRVEFVEALPRHELMLRCRQHDVGLAFMPTTSADVNLAHMTGASNKPFDYLACGLALLVSDLPDWRTMYVAPEYGLACDPATPASIAAALRWFLEYPEERRAMGERGRQRIAAEWNYEQEFQKVYQELC